MLEVSVCTVPLGPSPPERPVFEGNGKAPLHQHCSAVWSAHVLPAFTKSEVFNMFCAAFYVKSAGFILM